jgi:hypothetical protein
VFQGQHQFANFSEVLTMAQTLILVEEFSTLHAININPLSHGSKVQQGRGEEQGMESFPIGYMM